jgi:hypothetical protein
MKRCFLFLFFCVFYILEGNCRTGWFDKDAIWYYSTPYHHSGTDHCTKVEVTGDTIIKGLTCQVLSFEDGSTNKVLSTEYMHYRNDSVLFFNYYQDAFYLLYDFTANKGDTIVVHKNRFKATDGFLFSDSIDNFQYVVSKIDSVQLSGVWLKRQEVKPLVNGDWAFGFPYDATTYIIEKIGSLGYFFGRNGKATTMESIGMLRCYSDNEINYKNPDWDRECNFVNSLETHQSGVINIYTDPSNTEINFESTNNININSIEIIDFYGRSIKSIEVGYKKAKIDIGNLSSGLYFARISFSDKKCLSYKFLVTQKYEY